MKNLKWHSHASILFGASLFLASSAFAAPPGLSVGDTIKLLDGRVVKE